MSVPEQRAARARTSCSRTAYIGQSQRVPRLPPSAQHGRRRECDDSGGGTAEWWLVNDVAVVAQGEARWGGFFMGLALAVVKGPLYQCKFWHFKGENARGVGSHCSVTTFAQ